MRLNLSTKIAVLVVGMTTISTYIVGAWLYRSLAEEELSRSSTYLAGVIGRFEQKMTGYVDTLRLLGHTPWAHDLAEATSREGATEGALIHSREHLGDLFYRILADRPEYAQIRFIDRNGHELVRVHRHGGVVTVVEPQLLQDKSARPYFQQAMSLPQGEIHFSAIEINSEHGRFEPGTDYPTLRISMPIHLDGEAAGVVVINFFILNLFDELVADLDSSPHVLITNSQGDYLYHPDVSRTFGFDRGHPQRITQDFPQSGSFYRENGPKRQNFYLDNMSPSLILTLVREPIDRLRGSQSIVLAEVRPAHEALAHSLSQRRLTLILTIGAALLGLFFAFGVARQWVKPLNRMRRMAGELADVSLPESAGRDEVESLELTFQEMVGALGEKERRLRLALGVARLEVWDYNLQEHRVERIWLQLGELQQEHHETLSERELFSRFHPEDRYAIDTVFDDARHSEHSYRLTVRIDSGSGNYHWYELQLQPLEHRNGVAQRLLAVARDVTSEKWAEEALREQKEFAETLINTARVIILVLDSDGRILRFNPFFTALTGYELDDARGQLWFEDFIPERIRGAAHRRFTRLLGGKQRGEALSPILTSEGLELSISWKEAVLEDESGEANGILAIGHDVTADIENRRRLRHLADELQRSNATLRGIIDGTLDKVAAIDKEYRCIALNDAYRQEFEELYDHPLQIGDNLLEVLSTQPEEREKALQLWSRGFSGEQYSVVEEVIDSRHGRRFYEFTVSPVRNSQDEIIGAAHIIRDRTSEVEAEQTAVEREQRLSRIMENVADAIITIDEHGIIESVNQSALEIFGYGADELVGCNVSMLMPEPYRTQHDFYIERYLDTGHRHIIGTGPREVVGLRKNGEVFPMELGVSETRLAQGQRVFIGIVRDITAQKQQQAMLLQAQKMEAVGQLTGGVAHDFNNLLTVIIGNLRMLEDILADNSEFQVDDMELIEDALSAANDGSEMTRSLLAFSRKQSLQPESIPINETLHGLERFMMRSLGEDIELKFDLSGEVDTVKVDQRQLESALLNLVINSRDAMPGGGVITFTTRLYEVEHEQDLMQEELAPGLYVAIGVTDQGTGMSEETLANAITPFYTTKEAGKGSGLGLSMVYGFTEQSGGGMSIDTTEGEGTTITLYLPAGTAPNGEQEGVVEMAKGDGGATVLVVEDEARLRRLAVRTLTNQGYRTMEAPNAVVALEILKHEADIDLVFSDLIMPGGMNGYELAEWIYARQPEMPILLTTGFNRERNSDISSELVRRNIPLLMKPYTREQLLNWIHDLLNDDEE